MEIENQDSISSDHLGTVVRPPSINISRSLKTTLSGRLTPRTSPSFRRSPSVRTAARSDSRHLTHPPWYRKLFSRRLFPWLVVIGIWGYIGLLIQWAHTQERSGVSFDGSHHLTDDRHVISSQHNLLPPSMVAVNSTSKSTSILDKQQGSLATDATANKLLSTLHMPSSWLFPSVGLVNGSVGVLVGPFDEIENRILGPVLEQRLNACRSDGAFGEFVRGKIFVLVFHELSMTGSPLAMMELASEILRCGGKVIAITLSQKGGLLQELLARGIKVLKSKAPATFKFAARADLVIAGSAVCASWIDKYLLLYKKGSRRLAWWIMENRREYFDRSKHLLGFAKALIFLSDSQLKQWQAWSDLEHVILPRLIKVIPLSVNDEFASKAGLFESKELVENKRESLRDTIRSKMGLRPDDVLLTTLSSINPGKGQLKLIQALAMVMEDLSLHTQEIHSDQLTKQINLKLLIGSVGSKSNKVEYVERLLAFIRDHPYLAHHVLWTPVTVHVSSLYSASDAYIMNSQGLGETFGRVTVEAMAFGLPILGTDSGGTPEIVENDVSGMLHPVGSEGVSILAKHMKFILRNESIRKEMGLRGRHKVRKLYMKDTMYEKLAKAFIECFKEGRSAGRTR